MLRVNDCSSIVRSYTEKYTYPDITRGDVLGVFSQFKDLRPTKVRFTFIDGTQKDLLKIGGTIPVNYQSRIYNVPIAIFVMDTHPYSPPFVYVKPTNTMTIKPCDSVDSNGRVDLQYLKEWRYPQSDLSGLIQILLIVFSEMPPVVPTKGSVRKEPKSRTAQNTSTSECPSKWSIDEVCDFIKTVPESVPYVELFRKERIDGAALVLLDKKDFHDIFDMPFGIAVKIWSIVKELKKD